ncbi:MAG TPA: hypothetical protein VFE46_10640 [Pirellulales bacterium]|nr:hypothetical protein [Pirellulales bacterium]
MNTKHTHIARRFGIARRVGVALALVILIGCAKWVIAFGATDSASSNGSSASDDTAAKSVSVAKSASAANGGSANDSAAASKGTAASAGPTATLDLLRKSGGMLTPEVRSSYLAWCKQEVLSQLQSVKRTVPPEVLHEVETDPTLTDAIFGSVYPPDRTILENYIDMRAKLGASFTQKYRALVTAAAVVHRKGGVTNRNLADEEMPDAEDTEVGASPPEPEPDINLDAPDPEMQAAADFMKSTGSTALQIYEQPDKQQQLFDYLKSKGIDDKRVAKLEQFKALGRVLKGAMIILGQRPGKREPYADIITWLKYLATVYESKPNIPPVADRDPKHWPLFPMDKAPWPMLMPLARPMVMSDAHYIYEKFEGQHGHDRYHTYGPYRKEDAELRYELQPSTLPWKAWADRIIHGGVCTTMSGISIDTHRALCEPAVPAGQPHHSNLVSYHFADDKWSAHIDQAFAGGPPVTHVLWLFKDVADGPARLTKKSHAGAEYHLGLGAGMNVGLASYIDTRIAAALFRALPLEDKGTTGVKLLTAAKNANPFNPDLWYLLSQQANSAADGQWLVSALLSHAPNADLSGVGKEQKKEEKERKRKKEEPKTTPSEIAEREYWETVAKFVSRLLEAKQ